MRTTILLVFLLLGITSCNDSNKKQETISQKEESSDSLKKTHNSTPENIPERDSSANTTKENSAAESSTPIKTVEISGVYANQEHRDDTSCSCYCIDINKTGTSELCLKDNELYINARFQKNADKIDIYFTGQANGNSKKEIPWDKFDTAIPIAVLSPESNSTFKLDWKGFSINGEIAIDYALLGKKTLEGTYIKK